MKKRIKKMSFCPLSNLAQINHHLSAEGANKVFILRNKTAGYQNKMIQKQHDVKTPENQSTRTPRHMCMYQNSHISTHCCHLMKTAGHQNIRAPKHQTGHQRVFIMKMPEMYKCWTDRIWGIDWVPSNIWWVTQHSVCLSNVSSDCGVRGMIG